MDTKMNTPMDKPQYEHDCEKCKFLGRFSSEGFDYDLYFCLQSGNHPTVIARYGDDGPEYCSGICFDSPELTEAKRRAKVHRYL